MALPQGNDMHGKNGQKGFTLIVIGLLLLAFGMFVMSFIAPDAEVQKYREKTTREKLDKIRVAAAAFYKVNGDRYPCPARFNAAVNTSTFGVEVNACDAATNCATVANQTICPTTKTWVGAVPVATLNLSDDYAFDEWGNRFTYVVNNNNTFAIKNSDNSVIANTKINVISHGKNGKGAYNRAGTITKACTAEGSQTITNSELGNCNFSTDDIFIYSEWNNNLNNYYDDVTFRFSSE